MICAVILCSPTTRVEVVSTATPFESAVDPMLVEPSRKVTVPVLFVRAVVAVKVTDCPKVEGFSEEATVMVETVTGSTLEVLGL